MTGRTNLQFKEFLADFCLFAPFGIGYAFPLSEVMEMDLDTLDIFYKRKNEVIEALNKK